MCGIKKEPIFFEADNFIWTATSSTTARDKKGGGKKGYGLRSTEKGGGVLGGEERPSVENVRYTVPGKNLLQTSSREETMFAEDATTPGANRFSKKSSTPPKGKYAHRHRRNKAQGRARSILSKRGKETREEGKALASLKMPANTKRKWLNREGGGPRLHVTIHDVRRRSHGKRHCLFIAVSHPNSN